MDRSRVLGTVSIFLKSLCNNLSNRDAHTDGDKLVWISRINHRIL